MLKSRSVYLYGLDDRLGQRYDKDDTQVPVGNKYSTQPRNYDRFSGGTIHKNNNSFSSHEFFIKQKHQLSQNLSNALNVYQVSFLAMNKYSSSPRR